MNQHLLTPDSLRCSSYSLNLKYSHLLKVVMPASKGYWVYQKSWYLGSSYQCLVHSINIMRTTYSFISLEGKPFPAVSTNFKERSLILTNQQSLSLKSILDTKASIFTISDISTCGWCDGRDGGCNSLDCYTCDSPWHHFLFSSTVFLKDITRCETPGMYKWVPGLSGWEGNAGFSPFILQLTRSLKLCRLFCGISHC